MLLRNRQCSVRRSGTQVTDLKRWGTQIPDNEISAKPLSPASCVVMTAQIGWQFPIFVQPRHLTQEYETCGFRLGIANCQRQPNSLPIFWAWFSKPTYISPASRFNSGLGRLFVDKLLGFLHQPVLAKLSIALVRLPNAILESLNFFVYVYESICVRLILHDTLPLTRILLFEAADVREERAVRGRRSTAAGESQPVSRVWSTDTL